MKYYQSTCNKLIYHNPDKGTYKVCNTLVIVYLSKEQFDLLNTFELKKQKFYELLNSYFADVSQEWIYNGNRYSKYPKSFREVYPRYSTDNPFFQNKPYESVPFEGFCWYCGKVYQYRFMGSYEKMLLNDIYKPLFVKWTCLKNCYPILDISTNKII